MQARRTAVIRTKLTDVQNWLSQRHLHEGVRSSILRFFAEDWGQLQEEPEQTDIEALIDDEQDPLKEGLQVQSCDYTMSFAWCSGATHLQEVTDQADV